MSPCLNAGYIYSQVIHTLRDVRYWQSNEVHKLGLTRTSLSTEVAGGTDKMARAALIDPSDFILILRERVTYFQ